MHPLVHCACTRGYVRIQELVLDIFDQHARGKSTLDYPSYVRAVAEHPVVVQFAAGEGTERYGSGM